jgi:hypothetical protein
LAVIACGALAGEMRRVASGPGPGVEVHALPALLHDRPSSIASAVEALAADLLGRGRRVAVAYADCGTYGALDDVCLRLGLERLEGLHCYDVIGGPGLVGDLLDEEPGTYLLTDFLIRSFRRLVVAELGLDRHPELVADYFGHYRRIVWLAGDPTPGLEGEARAIAGLLGLRLEIRHVGNGRLASSLMSLVSKLPAPA